MVESLICRQHGETVRNGSSVPTTRVLFRVTVENCHEADTVRKTVMLLRRQGYSLSLIRVTEEVLLAPIS